MIKFYEVIQAPLAPALFFTQISCHDINGFYARNLKTVSSIYNLTVYPNNVPIIQQGGAAVPAGLFNQNATGRISPIGNFTGFEDSIEYFFGLAPVPVPPLYGAFTSSNIVSFSSGCSEVAASVVYLEMRVNNASLPNSGQFLSILKEVTLWRFDGKGAVLYYEAWIPNLTAELLASSLGTADLTNPQIQAGLIESLCPQIQERCTGANQVYTDVDQCISTLSAKPFGIYDETWGDNVVCRNIHALLTLIRPAVHCPHAGPTGGMKCVDWPYNSGYFDDQLLFREPAGDTFICPSP